MRPFFHGSPNQPYYNTFSGSPRLSFTYFSFLISPFIFLRPTEQGYHATMRPFHSMEWIVQPTILQHLGGTSSGSPPLSSYSFSFLILYFFLLSYFLNAKHNLTRDGQADAGNAGNGMDRSTKHHTTPPQGHQDFLSFFFSFLFPHFLLIISLFFSRECQAQSDTFSWWPTTLPTQLCSFLFPISFFLSFFLCQLRIWPWLLMSAHYHFLYTQRSHAMWPINWF